MPNVTVDRDPPKDAQLSWRALATNEQFRAALLWAIGLSLAFLIVYGGCIQITYLRDRHDPSSIHTFYFDWERSIPFLALMILPYMSIDIFFFFSPFCCRDRAEMRGHGQRMIAALGIAAICFLLYPLKMGNGFAHPPVGGLLGSLFTLLGGFDRPYNLVPSLHIAFRSLVLPVYARRVRGMTSVLLHAWFALIVVSTLLTWQHHVIDIIAGQALAIICLWLLPDIKSKPSA